jgi:hypothetical protein
MEWIDSTPSVVVERRLSGTEIGETKDRSGVGCRCSWPAAGGPLYFTHRNFDAERPVRAGQLSVAAVRWAVLDGHERSVATGGFRQSKSVAAIQHWPAVPSRTLQHQVGRDVG